MKISKIKENSINLFHSQSFWIRVCSVGILLLVIQNFFWDENTAQRVYVVGGNIDANVSGSVDVDNIVPVRVTNTVMTW